MTAELIAVLNTPTGYALIALILLALATCRVKGDPERDNRLTDPNLRGRR